MINTPSLHTTTTENLYLLVCEPVHLLAGSVTVEHLLARATPLLRVHLPARAARELIHIPVPPVQRRHHVVQRGFACKEPGDIYNIWVSFR